jgi:hypothetical protein
MRLARVAAPILSIAAVCGCAEPVELEAGDPGCSPAWSLAWGARASPPSDDGWIELRAASLASAGPALPPAAVSCKDSARLTPESFRIDTSSHALDLLLKNYADASVPLTVSAHVSYVLEDADGAALATGEVALTNASSIAAGSTLRARGHVGTSRQIERVWACVRL